MTIRATIVPDIMRHRHIPGALQFDATNRGLRLSCPCGCGQTWSVSFQHWQWDGNRSAPSLTEKLELLIEHSGTLYEHWSGHLTKGEFVGQPHQSDAEVVSS